MALPQGNPILKVTKVTPRTSNKHVNADVSKDLYPLYRFPFCKLLVFMFCMCFRLKFDFVSFKDLVFNKITFTSVYNLKIHFK